jgi:hypothetical protein
MNYCSKSFFLEKDLASWRLGGKISIRYPAPLIKTPADSVALGAFSAARTLPRLGRRTNAPSPFGHRHSTAAAQCGQNVHSYMQIKANLSMASDLPHRSQVLFISSAIAPLLSMTIRDDCY